MSVILLETFSGGCPRVGTGRVQAARGHRQTLLRGGPGGAGVGEHSQSSLWPRTAGSPVAPSRPRPGSEQPLLHAAAPRRSVGPGLRRCRCRVPEAPSVFLAGRVHSQRLVFSCSKGSSLGRSPLCSRCVSSEEKSPAVLTILALLGRFFLLWLSAV